MGRCSTYSLVIAVAVLVLVQRPVAIAQAPGPDPIIDTEAYAVYSELLPPLWASRSTPLLIGEETHAHTCNGIHVPDQEWQSAWDDYVRENSRGRRLLYMFPTISSYLLVPSADMRAEGARLVAQYPGGWQHRPGQTDYAIVSAVGFDLAKTRAVVAINVGDSGSVNLMEKRDGHWVRAQTPGLVSCAWGA
jgi:hypothetical protein